MEETKMVKVKYANGFVCEQKEEVADILIAKGTVKRLRGSSIGKDESKEKKDSKKKDSSSK